MDQTVNNQSSYGEAFFAWEFTEFDRHIRTRTWYLAAGAAALALITYSIFTSNLLFALIILLVAFITIVRDYVEPNTITFVLYEDGIGLGTKFIPYKELANFYIIYEPPRVKRLYFKPKGMGQTISIPLYDQNPIEIREILLRYVKEDLETEYEHPNDSWGNLLRL